MQDQVTANKRRSAVVAAGFVAVVATVLLCANALVGGGVAGAVVAALLAAAAVAAAYWWSGELALAVSRARPADPVEHARLYNLVEGLCAAAGLPRPRIFVVDDDAPNAFSVGRNPRSAAVAVTTGLLAKLNRIELEAVLAHELSHVKNYDVLVSTLAVTMVGLAALLSDRALRSSRSPGDGAPGAVVAVLGMALLPLAALAARAMRLAVSPRREAVADLTGVSLTRYPPGLIAALEKLRDERPLVRSGSPATAHLWLESPVPRADSEGRLAWLGRLADTHPPLEERIEALREL